MRFSKKKKRGAPTGKKTNEPGRKSNLFKLPLVGQHRRPRRRGPLPRKASSLHQPDLFRMAVVWWRRLVRRVHLQANGSGRPSVLRGNEWNGRGHKAGSELLGLQGYGRNKTA